MSNHAKTEVELDEALALLDHELEHLALEEPIRIRAIGGYALIKHGIRPEERAFTVDIDTVTADYDSAVQQAIEVVAEKAGLEPGWLNNDNLGGHDPELVELLYDAEWVPQESGGKNIDLALASIETLTRAKIIAADSAPLSGRTQDGPDLISLLQHQGITSTGEFERAYPDPYGEFPETYGRLRRHFARGPEQNVEDDLPTASLTDHPARARFTEIGEQIDLLIETAEDDEPMMTISRPDGPGRVVTERGYWEAVAESHRHLGQLVEDEVSQGRLETAIESLEGGSAIVEQQIEIGRQAQLTGPSVG